MGRLEIVAKGLHTQLFAIADLSLPSPLSWKGLRTLPFPARWISYKPMHYTVVYYRIVL